MEKKFLLGLLSLAFVALLVLNVNFLQSGEASSLTIIRTMMIANADGEGTGTKYATRNTETGTVTEYVTINGVSYTRTCSYHQILCSGSGDLDCTPKLTTSGCSVWS